MPHYVVILPLAGGFAGRYNRLMSDSAVIESPAVQVGPPPSVAEGGEKVVKRPVDYRSRQSYDDYKKPTQVEIAERVELCQDMIFAGARKRAIVSAVKERWGVSTRTVESYISRAQRQMVDESGRSKEMWRAEQLGKYLAIAHSDASRPIDKIKALERIDKILGLEIHAPRQVELTGKDGGPITSQAAVVVLGVDLSSKIGEFAGPLRQAAIANFLESMGVAPAAITDAPVSITLPEQAEKVAKQAE